MRLLVVTQYFWPENFRINDMVAEFVRRGHHVTVLTGLPNYPDGKLFPAYKENPTHYTEFNGARVVRVPLITRGKSGIRLILNYLSFAISASLIGSWRLRGATYDAVLVYEPSPITVGIPGVVLRTLKRAPMVLWVLDLWPETLKAVGAVKSDRVLRWVGKLVTFIYRRCDLILAQSKSFIPSIRTYAGKDSRIEYFPNWAESVFDGGAIQPATEVPPAEDYFTVMFAGNIGEAQDFPAILAAAERLWEHKVRWLIVGDGRMAEWLKHEIKSRNLDDNIQMLGRHPLERMPAFFLHADALLVSLKDEPIFALTIPGKLQSYLAAGIPVIAMLNGEGADILSENLAGLSCAAGDSAGLASAVLQLAAMTKIERQSMGTCGRALYENEFARQLLLNKAEQWLLDLIAMKRASR